MFNDSNNGGTRGSCGGRLGDWRASISTGFEEGMPEFMHDFRLSTLHKNQMADLGPIVLYLSSLSHDTRMLIFTKYGKREI